MAQAVDPNNKNYECRAYQRMKRKWQKIHDLKGGTEAMRTAGKRWLPKEEAESDKAYKNRLQRSFLFNGYADTHTKLVSKPFSRPVILRNGDKQTENMARISGDVDQTGKDLTAFAAEVFGASIDYGLTHILVDYPEVAIGEATQADVTDARPSFVHVPPTALINWRSEGVGVNATLTEIWIREVRSETVSGSTFAEQDITYVRIYRKDSWEIWKSNGLAGSAAKWESVKNGVNSLGKIPLVTIYTNRTGFMEGEPALDDLAWLNIYHWQSQSDQNCIVSFSRFGILFAKGMSAEEKKEGLDIGPRRLVSVENENADLTFVEQTGAAIQAGERDLRATEQRMEVLGMQPYVQRQGVETATGKQIHESKTVAAIQLWVQRLSTTLFNAYGLAAEWEDTTLPKDFAVDIFDDFDMSMKVAGDMQILLDACVAGKVSDELFLIEGRRRGVFHEGLDIEAELSKHVEPAPDLTGGGGPGASKRKPGTDSRGPTDKAVGAAAGG